MVKVVALLADHRGSKLLVSGPGGLGDLTRNREVLRKFLHDALISRAPLARIRLAEIVGTQGDNMGFLLVAAEAVSTEDLCSLPCEVALSALHSPEQSSGDKFRFQIFSLDLDDSDVPSDKGTVPSIPGYHPVVGVFEGISKHTIRGTQPGAAYHIALDGFVHTRMEAEIAKCLEGLAHETIELPSKMTGDVSTKVYLYCRVDDPPPPQPQSAVRTWLGRMARDTSFAYRSVLLSDSSAWTEVVTHLEQRYKSPGFVFRGEKLPATILWSNTAAVIDPDAILGNLDHRQAVEMASKDERKYIKAELERGPIKSEATNYRMIKISSPGGSVPSIDGALGLYYDNVITQYGMEWELSKALSSLSDVRGVSGLLRRDGALPRRERVEASTGDPLRDGEGRCAAMTISMLFAFRLKDGYYCLVRRRSKEVAVSQGLYHVVPAGMFEKAYGDAEKEWSVRFNILRELLEEVYDVTEAQWPNEGLPESMYGISPLPRLMELEREGKAQLSVTGVCSDLLTCRTEICTVLVVDDVAFAHERAMHINWEYDKSPYRGGAFAVKVEGLEEFLDQEVNARKMVSTGAVSLMLGREWLRNVHGV